MESGALIAGTVRASDPVIQRIGWYVEAVLRLGRRTADLHLALAADTETAAFAPAPLTRAYVEHIARATADQAEAAFADLDWAG